MDRELIICVPGPWSDRSVFLRHIITHEPKGRFMLIGSVLADLAAKDRVTVDFCEADTRLAESFRIAGQGKLPESVLDEVGGHSAVLYLHFPLDILGQRERILKFTRLIRDLGGLAVKLESSGTAHTWEQWESRLTGSLFDLYCASVVLVGDEEVYYSCGMHHFGLPECAVPRSIQSGAAAGLMNLFSAWLLNERPDLVSGEILNIGSGRPAFRVLAVRDGRHAEDDLFHNPHGLWQLEPVDAKAESRWTAPLDEPLFVAISQDDQAMAAAYERARETLPLFLGAIRTERFGSAINSVKLKLRDQAHSAELGEDQFAYLWVWDVREDAGGLLARVVELPKGGINDLKEGADVRFSSAEVYDWMMHEGSQAWGGFTLRAVRANMGPKERLQYDGYTGILAYRDPPFQSDQEPGR